MSAYFHSARICEHFQLVLVLLRPKPDYEKVCFRIVFFERIEKAFRLIRAPRGIERKRNRFFVGVHAVYRKFSYRSTCEHRRAAA